MKKFVTPGDLKMSKFSDRIVNTKGFARHDRMFDIRSFSQLQPKTFDDVNGDLRLRRVLKRAIERETAPQTLIDSIKKGIRG
jgi:hypothetical protein